MTYEELKSVLKEKGYKMTPQRIAVLEAIVENPGKHLSTEEIYDLVKVTFPEIGLATVYRTLILLDELEVISKLNLEDGCVRYEINDNEERHHHHHLICSTCGKVLEVEVDLLDELESKIEKDYDFEIRDHKLKFYGLCSDCRKTL